MTVYLDSNFICHIENADGRRAVETAFFDGKAKAFVEGYRFVPMGETWVRSDGVEFHGEMVSPIKDYMQVMTDVAISYLDDEQAESVTVLFQEWEVGVRYQAEDKDKGIPADRRQYGGLLYKCVQSHTSQADWTPDITPALWVRTSTEEWPEWVQPTGAHDAYPLGAKVSHNGKHWVNVGKDGNEYEPGVWGWDEVA